MVRLARLGTGALQAVVLWTVFSSCHFAPGESPFADADADAGVTEPAFYSYEADSGRIVFVNDRSLIPSDKRSTAKPIDVSGIDLHHEYAASFARVVDEKLEDLRESTSCSEAMVETQASTAARVWHRHGAWIVGLSLCLALVFMSPWMGRLLPGGEWSRLLMIAFPVIFFVTLVAFTATRAKHSMQSVDELADLCDEADHEATGDLDATTKKRVGEVQRMKTLITRMYSERDTAIKQVLDSE